MHVRGADDVAASIVGDRSDLGECRRGSPRVDAAIGSRCRGRRLRPGPSSSVEHVAARDGTPLLVRHWPVPDGRAWASLLLVHGLAEHSGRYEHVGAQLAAAGIEAEAFDLRGFGGSGGPRASVDRWSQLHDDLEERVAAVAFAWIRTGRSCCSATPSAG